MTILSRLCYLLKSWYTDEFCDAKALETFLKVYMGPRVRVFNHHPGPFAVKVGVTAATIEADSIIFTNYNGTSATSQCSNDTESVLRLRSSDDKLGYKLVQLENIEDEPCLWEAWVLLPSFQIKADSTVDERPQLHLCKLNSKIGKEI